jgi:monofunctional glycosyltransferase
LQGKTGKHLWLRRLLRAMGFAALAWVVLTVGAVLLLRWFDPTTSSFMQRARLAAWQTDRPWVLRQQWIDLQRVAPVMRMAVVASEDQKFCDHWGFDFASIDSALAERGRGRRRGASTISQQVAKNLFLWPGQSWVRKGVEAYLTALIEAIWPKHRILEVYLNIAEFGDGIYGVEAASRRYFGKSATQLNAYDAALLAAVLPNPIRMRVEKPSLYVRSRQHWIAGQMRGIAAQCLQPARKRAKK